MRYAPATYRHPLHFFVSNTCPDARTHAPRLQLNAVAEAVEGLHFDGETLEALIFDGVENLAELEIAGAAHQRAFADAFTQLRQPDRPSPSPSPPPEKLFLGTLASVFGGDADDEDEEFSGDGAMCGAATPYDDYDFDNTDAGYHTNNAIKASNEGWNDVVSPPRPSLPHLNGPRRSCLACPATPCDLSHTDRETASHSCPRGIHGATPQAIKMFAAAANAKPTSGNFMNHGISLMRAGHVQEVATLSLPPASRPLSACAPTAASAA